MSELPSNVAPVEGRADGGAASVELKPIGGWLLLPTCGLILSLITGLLNLARMLLMLDRRGAQGGTAWHTYATFNVLAQVAYLPFLIVVTFLFFRRDRLAPILMVASYAVGLLLRALDHTLAGRVESIAAGADHARAGRLLIFSLCFGLVWGAYFLFSKRVKETFVN